MTLARRGHLLAGAAIVAAAPLPLILDPTA